MARYHKVQLSSIFCAGTSRYVVDASAYENLPASRSELHDLGVIR